MSSAGLFTVRGQHPRSAESSLGAAIKAARKAGHLTPEDVAALGLARQSSRALDDALRGDERADNVATLVRAHLAVLGALGLTPAARRERQDREVDDLAGLMAELDVPT